MGNFIEIFFAINVIVLPIPLVIACASIIIGQIKENPDQRNQGFIYAFLTLALILVATLIYVLYSNH